MKVPQSIQYSGPYMCGERRGGERKGGEGRGGEGREGRGGERRGRSYVQRLKIKREVFTEWRGVYRMG